MNRTRIKTIRYRVGRNHYVVIHIYQSAAAHAMAGNALASNALNIQITKRSGRK